MNRDQSPTLRAEALATIPDSPLSVEFRAMTLDARSTVARSGNGWVLVDGRSSLLGAVGAVDPHDVQSSYATTRRGCEILADATAFERLQQVWTFVPAKIVVLARPWSRPPCGQRPPAVRPLLPRDELGHLPTGLREDIEGLLEHRLVMAGFVGERPVSFAAAPWMTKSYADVSIDTLAEHRRQGIGRTVVTALFEHLLEVGKTPVWGATVDNTASLAMAASLGITSNAGELYVYQP